MARLCAETAQHVLDGTGAAGALGLEQGLQVLLLERHRLGAATHTHHGGLEGQYALQHLVEGMVGHTEDEDRRWPRRRLLLHPLHHILLLLLHHHRHRRLGSSATFLSAVGRPGRPGRPLRLLGLVILVIFRLSYRRLDRALRSLQPLLPLHVLTGEGPSSRRSPRLPRLLPRLLLHRLPHLQLRVRVRVRRLLLGRCRR